MERNKKRMLLFLLLLILGLISSLILVKDITTDLIDFQEEKLIEENYNCNTTLKYSYYNYTTKEVTYRESNHKICNKIVSK